LDSQQELDRFSRQNEKELEVARCFLLARDGRKCNICKKSVEELQLYDKILRQVQDRRPRKYPVLVMNHRDETKNFHKNGVLFANVELVCCSCNKKFKPAEVDYDPEEVRTYASRKSHNAYVKWVKMVNNHLAKFGHGCEERLVNKYSKVIKCSQDILKKYDKREYETRWDLFEISDLNIECDYKYCSGVHICFWNERPEPIKTDLEALKEEEEN